jgi:aldose 1-epimerase
LITLRRGRTRATVAPAAGGRLLQLWIEDGGRWLPLLKAPRDVMRAVSEPLAWGCFPMAPWPNRIDGGRFLWRGRAYDVSGGRAGHALHGRACYLPWTVESVTPRSCRLHVEFDGVWPFGGRALQEIAVVDDGIDLRIEVEATEVPFPAGAGWHPWFRSDVRPGHDVRVFVDAEQVYETEEMIPTGWLLPAVRQYDLRGYPALGPRRLDACYRHPRGPLRIAWGDVELTMAQSPEAGHAVVYTPREAVCVEPQTCAIDAFNLAAQGIAGVGAVVVEAGRPLVALTSWRWRVG